MSVVDSYGDVRRFTGDVEMRVLVYNYAATGNQHPNEDVDTPPRPSHFPSISVAIYTDRPYIYGISGPRPLLLLPVKLHTQHDCWY